MLYIIIIYLMGYLLTYYLVKKLRNKTNSNKWSDVFFTMFISLYSWWGVFIVIGDVIDEVIDFKNIKPPKWL